MMCVILYSSIAVVIFTVSIPPFISSSILNDNIKENLEIEMPINLDNSTNLSLEVQLSNRNLEVYQDCTKILINKTREKSILLEYNYYEGYYLYPRLKMF